MLCSSNRFCFRNYSDPSFAHPNLVISARPAFIAAVTVPGNEGDYPHVVRRSSFANIKELLVKRGYGGMPHLRKPSAGLCGERVVYGPYISSPLLSSVHNRCIDLLPTTLYARDICADNEAVDERLYA